MHLFNKGDRCKDAIRRRDSVQVHCSDASRVAVRGCNASIEPVGCERTQVRAVGWGQGWPVHG